MNVLGKAAFGSHKKGEVYHTYSEGEEGDEGDGMRTQAPVECSWVWVFHDRCPSSRESFVVFSIVSWMHAVL
jgi:hypothetical protein